MARERYGVLLKRVAFRVLVGVPANVAWHSAWSRESLDRGGRLARPGALVQVLVVFDVKLLKRLFSKKWRRCHKLRDVGAIFLKGRIERPGRSSVEGKRARKRSCTSGPLDDSVFMAQATVVGCANDASKSAHRASERGSFTTHARSESPLVLR